MSDDETPELPMESQVEAPQSENKSPARKTTRKRAVRKTAEKAAPEAAEEPRPAETPQDASSPVEPTESATAAAPERDARPSDDGAPAPDRTGKVTRISSKPGREPEESTRSLDDGEERVAVIEEPPGADNQREGGKRRRRRRRRSGDSGESNGEPVSKPDLDPEQLAKKAWKIFLSEVSEEGLALINDNDARQLSQRSFKLAEIFLEEAARRQ